MINKYSRAQRRCDYARLKKVRANYWGYGTSSYLGDRYMQPRTLGLSINTPSPCSCWMCKNPRKVWKGKENITIQERKAKDFAKDSLEEIQ